MVDGLILVKLQQFLDFTFNLVGVHQFVHHLHLNQLLLFAKCEETIGVGIQRINADFAALRNIVEHHFPDACHIGGNLLAVRLAHLIGGHRFRSTLVFANLGQLVLYAKLSQHVLQEVRLCGQSVPVNHTLRVQENLVGNTTEIIGALSITVAIGDNPLAALLEVEQGLANGMQRSRRICSEDTSFNIDALDVFIVFCFMDGIDDFVQAQAHVVIAK